MIVTFWALQIFNVVALFLNAALAIYNLANGSIFAGIVCFSVTGFLLYSLASATRRYVEFRREERAWTREIQELASADVAGRFLRVGNQYIPLSNFLLRPPDWIPQRELELCLELRKCPDCGADQSLGFALGTFTCSNPECRSRFTIDANGKWERA